MVKQKKVPLTLEERKSKARWARIFKVYGITRDDYNTLDMGRCIVCLRDWGDSVRPNVDHDHVTGEIRGLLCNYCNHRRVGRHRDPQLLHRIGDYLTPPFTGFIIPKKKKTRKKRAVAKPSSIRKKKI